MESLIITDQDLPPQNGTGVQKAARVDFVELGVSGLTRWDKQSRVDEEFLRDLRGSRGMKVYREMRENDETINAVMFAAEMLMRNAGVKVEGNDPEGVEFVEQCKDDMSHTWDDFMSEVLSMLTYGFHYAEIIYKLRAGESNNPTRNSKYSDGRVGWRKLATRSQDSLQDWQWAKDDGSVEAFIQLAPPTYQLVAIPITKSLLFRPTSYKNSPEGRSALRGAYVSYYRKKHIEEIEAIGIERDLCGIPVFWVDPDFMAQYQTEFDQIIRNMRRNEQEGLRVPLIRDAMGNKRVEVELLKSGGQRQFDTTPVIHRYRQAIAGVVLGSVTLLGQQQVGSFALSKSLSGMFELALAGWLKSICEVLNRFGLPRLWRVNPSLASVEMPRFVPGRVEQVDLEELGNYVGKIAGAGAPLFPNPELENALLLAAKLPPQPEGTERDAMMRAQEKEPPPEEEPEPELVAQGQGDAG